MLFLIASLFPAAAGICLSVLRMEKKKRHILYVLAALAGDALVLAAMKFGRDRVLLTFTQDVTLRFSADGIGRFFALAAMILYTAACFYSFEYMEKEENEERFFAFFFISFGAMISVCFSGNLITLYLCFETLTLTTVPLVLHEMTKEAVAAGLKYLFYSIAGALMGLFAIFFVYHFASAEPVFAAGGFIDPAKLQGREQILLWAALAGIVGFGTKAGLYPMHGWLPTAHPIAPAPASALLSGIIAKAGVIAVIRLIYYSVGPDLIRGTWVQTAWMVLAMLTVFMGSMMAFREKVLKKRLAFSTISQISYILLSLSFLSEEGLEGGLLHAMGHAAAKGCLFLCAGVFICKLGIRRVEDLKGIGKRMPVTLWCFTVASLSLIGIPPLAGFLSKWVIASAAIGSGIPGFRVAAPVILLISALLTGGYLLPVVVNGFFPGHEPSPAKEEGNRSAEPSALMTVPMIALCAVVLLMGVAGKAVVGAFGF